MKPDTSRENVITARSRHPGEAVRSLTSLQAPHHAGCGWGAARLLTAAALAVMGATAHARPIHDSSDMAMAHRQGRAGIVSGSMAVMEPDAWRNNGDHVTVTFDPGTAERTNMPRGQRHEPPVADRTGR